MKQDAGQAGGIRLGKPMDVGAAQAGGAAAGGQAEQPLDGQLEALAVRALDASRTRLMMAFRFMDRALWRMPFVPAEAEAARKNATPDVRRKGVGPNDGAPEKAPSAFVATDGSALFFDALGALENYRDDANRVVRAMLHSVLHCVFRHPFRTVRAEPKLWGLACDICVEATAVQLCNGRFALPEDRGLAEFMQRLEADGVALVPSGIYRALLECRAHQEQRLWLAPYADEPAAAGAPFARDSHRLWDLVPPRKNKDERRKNDDEQPPEDDDQPGFGLGGEPQGERSGFGLGAAKARDASEAERESQKAERDWRDIAQQMQTEMRSHAKACGNDLGNLASNLELANRSEIDYEDFLRRFCLRAEELKTNQDEFDYIFYTYGLKLYGNMPLIEPLEYLEVENLRDFVIAVDTSGSCSGELVRAFLTRTCEILEQAQALGGQTSVYVIQADLAVQSVALVESRDDLRELIDTLQVRGGGGTDFRPVFAYVERLREQGKLQNLKGMVYFTDGLGPFPSAVPDYDVAFVFVEDEGKKTYVPPWAMRVVLGRFDIEQLEAAGRAGPADGAAGWRV